MAAPRIGCFGLRRSDWGVAPCAFGAFPHDNANKGRSGLICEGCGKVTIASEATFERQTKAIRAVFGFGRQVGIISLGLVDQLGVVAKVHFQQLGMAIKPQGFPDERIELTGQEIGQVEGCYFIVMRRECL